MDGFMRTANRALKEQMNDYEYMQEKLTETYNLLDILTGSFLIDIVKNDLVDLGLELSSDAKVIVHVAGTSDKRYLNFTVDSFGKDKLLDEINVKRLAIIEQPSISTDLISTYRPHTIFKIMKSEIESFFDNVSKFHRIKK